MTTEAPQPPMFTASVDHARATIRARGRIDRLGADLLCGTVESLQHSGHRHITLQITPLATADREAEVLLRSLATELRTRGTRLTVS